MIAMRLKRVLVALLMAVSLSGSLFTLAAPTAMAAGSGCNAHFLTFPTWYRGLVDGRCELKQPGKNGAPNLQGYIIQIVLNVLEIALQLVAYVSVGFIMYGGVLYLTQSSDSSKIASARKTIQNAVIGLVISFLSVAVVNLITNNIK